MISAFAFVFATIKQKDGASPSASVPKQEIKVGESKKDEAKPAKKFVKIPPKHIKGLLPEGSKFPENLKRMQKAGPKRSRPKRPPEVA